MSKFTAYRIYRLFMLRKDKMNGEELTKYKENVISELERYCKEKNVDYRELIAEFDAKFIASRIG